MAEQKKHKRSFHCTDDQWKTIGELARKAGFNSVNAYMLQQCLGDEKQLYGNALILTPEEQRKMQSAIRFMAHRQIEYLKEKGYSDEDIVAMLSEAETSTPSEQ